MKLLIIVCQKFNLEPPQIFKCAYDYFEIRVSETRMEEEFYSCCFMDTAGKIFIVRVPKFVEDFCVEVLMGKISLPTKEEMMAMS